MLMQKEVNTNEIKKQIEDNTYRWYVLSVTSGQEALVIENLQERVNKQGLSEDVVDYLSPLVSEVAMKKWEKVVRQKKLCCEKYTRCKTYCWSWDKADSFDGWRICSNAKSNPASSGKIRVDNPL